MLKVTFTGSTCETVVSNVGVACPTRLPMFTCAVPTMPSTGE